MLANEIKIHANCRLIIMHSLGYSLGEIHLHLPGVIQN